MSRSLGGLFAVVVTAVLLAGAGLFGQGRRAGDPEGDRLTMVLGRPTDGSIVVSVLAPAPLEAFAEYGIRPGSYPDRTDMSRGSAGTPFEIQIEGLKPNTRYYYRLQHRAPGASAFEAEPEHTFVTQRARGSAFTFAVQGDSHPERAGRMYDAALYQRTLEHVRDQQPDFYLMLGDDFSIERLIARGTLSQQTVNGVYAAQRAYLATVSASTPLFLVNGNHEEAARFLLNGTADNAAVYAGKARTTFYPLPVPNDFYSGDTVPIDHIGLVGDYYAWTWGDALFVVVDPYWHSSVQVDADPGGGGAAAGRGGRGNRRREPNASRLARVNRDLWAVTIGDAQYAWLKHTLESSNARFKFVFAHHVLGTGRGGVEEAVSYEWGGRDPRGNRDFRSERPTWGLPIHQLMAKTGVTIFFQGHDHLFAHQEKDGVVYQETPNPADPTYQAFNRDAYRSGDILPNSGHLRVTVSPTNVRVEYVRSFLPKDEQADRHDGDVAFSYTVAAR